MSDYTLKICCQNCAVHNVFVDRPSICELNRIEISGKISLEMCCIGFVSKDGESLIQIKSREQENIINRLSVQNAKYRAALEEYADEKNWSTGSDWLEHKNYFLSAQVNCSEGHKLAQEVLKEEEK
jgi:hypothetical protein